MVDPVTHAVHVPSGAALPVDEKYPWEHTQNVFVGSGCAPSPHATVTVVHVPCALQVCPATVQVPQLRGGPPHPSGHGPPQSNGLPHVLGVQTGTHAEASALGCWPAGQ